MDEDRGWTPEEQRFLDGDGPPPVGAGDRARAERFASAVREWSATVPLLDERVDAGVMAALRARSRAGRAAWWRWFVEPRRVVLRPALAAAAALALISLSSLATVLLRPRPAAVPTAGARAAVPLGTVLVRFELAAPDAERVALAGSFNAWSDTTTPFARNPATGIWTVTVPLPPGEHQYLFVIDGERWVPDPSAHAQVEDEFGQTNSVLVVGPRGVVRS